MAHGAPTTVGPKAQRSLPASAPLPSPPGDPQSTIRHFVAAAGSRVVGSETAPLMSVCPVATTFKSDGVSHAPPAEAPPSWSFAGGKGSAPDSWTCRAVSYTH